MHGWRRRQSTTSDLPAPDLAAGWDIEEFPTRHANQTRLFAGHCFDTFTGVALLVFVPFPSSPEPLRPQQ